VDVGQEALGVAGVGAVGVAACGVVAAGFFLDEVAVGGDGVEQGEGRDAAAFVFEHLQAALGMAELVVAHREVEMAAGDGHEEFHGLGDTGGRKDVHRGLAAAEVHGAEQAGQAEEVVAVEVGEEDGAHGLEFLMVDAHLGLGVLAAVEHEAGAVDVDYLSAAVAGDGGQRCSGTEYGGVEVHLEAVFSCLLTLDLLIVGRLALLWVGARGRPGDKGGKGDALWVLWVVGGVAAEGFLSWRSR